MTVLFVKKLFLFNTKLKRLVFDHELKIWIILALFFSKANCKGVRFLVSNRFTSAFLNSSFLTKFGLSTKIDNYIKMYDLPDITAKCKGVSPSLSCLFIS